MDKEKISKELNELKKKTEINSNDTNKDKILKLKEKEISRFNLLAGNEKTKFDGPNKPWPSQTPYFHQLHIPLLPFLIFF